MYLLTNYYLISRYRLVSIIPLSKIFGHELEPPHERVLSVMKDDKFLSLREITAAIVKKYPNSPEVVKWKKRVGDISRYQVARYLKTLEREGYVECNNEFPNRWRRLRQDSLLNEVVQGFVLEGKAKNRIEALKKLADAYVDKHKTEFEQYVSAVRKAGKINEIKNRELKAAWKEARSALERLQSGKNLVLNSSS